jgi:apolipoprotein N-acyltransferase
MKRQVNFALAALSGLLLVLIHPGASFTFLAPLALVPLLIAVSDEPSGRERFLLGWLAGILQWGGMCYWIQGTLAQHGGMGAPLATLLFVLYALYKGLHCAVFAWLAGWLWGLRWAAPAMALLWVGLERTHGELGFTWLLLGNAGSNMGVPMRLAPLVGVYGVSFVFALLGATVAVFYVRRERLLLACAAPLVGMYLLPELPDVKAGDMNAAVVQPNLPEEVRMSDAELHEAYDKIARRTIEEVLAPGKRRASLVLWPEVPASLYFESDHRFRTLTESVARLSQAPFLFGTVRFHSNGNPLNTAQLLTTTGDPVGVYDKMRLVPFGEFVPPPFDRIVDKVSQEAGVFQRGEAIRVFPTPGGKLGVFICYESAFADHVREITKQGADVLVNLTNDGYFSRSAARAQHLQLSRMRAAENARWLLRPTNDGFTASIDPAGRVIDELTPFRTATGRLQYATAFRTTIYTNYGDGFAWFALLTGLTVVAYARWRDHNG